MFITAVQSVKAPDLPKDLFSSVDKSMTKGLDSHLQSVTRDFQQQAKGQKAPGVRDLGIG